MYHYENEAYAAGFTAVCGVDEAGRGPLAGDVYAAAVILPRGVEIAGVNDSKKLSEKKREQLFDAIIQSCTAYCIASADVQEIEQMNILAAALLAMRRAVQGLAVPADYALVDGNQDPGFPGIRAQTIVGGDGKSASIAAASILAKVARDRQMLALAQQYPQYQFEKHKGYGTKLHYECLREHGASPVHRRSFLRKFYKEEQARADKT